MALFTVLMPAYNCERYIAEAIESILRQSIDGFELLVLDDGSNDQTPIIAAQFAATDRRVRVIRRQRQGQVASRNELLQLAGTEIIAWADADDIALPQRFERQLAVMLARPKLHALGASMIVIDGAGAKCGHLRNPVGSAAVALALQRRVSISQPSAMLRRRAALEAGGFRAAYEGAEDYDLFLRMSERGELDNLDCFGVYYRKHGESVSHRNANRQLLSADLARATHVARSQGRPDPTTTMSEPPNVDCPVLDEILGEDMRFHRAMARAASTNGWSDAGLLPEILALPVSARRARPIQKAIAAILQRRPFDVLTLRAALHGFRLGPRRFLKLTLKSA
jgi:hypothetical protein